MYKKQKFHQARQLIAAYLVVGNEALWRKKVHVPVSHPPRAALRGPAVQTGAHSLELLWWNWSFL